LKKLNLVLALMLGAALALACSGGGDKSTNTTDEKEQPANTETAKTDKAKSSDSAQDANVFTHKEGGIRFEVPTGWKATPDGDNMTVSSADGGLQVVFWVPDEDSFDAAVKELDKEVSKTIKHVKTVGKPTQDTHNGMTHYGESGTGDVNGNTIAWSVDVLSARKPVIILSFAAPNLYQKNSADYEKLINSIRKIS
jgi:glucose/arabinose dehydrogenase